MVCSDSVFGFIGTKSHSFGSNIVLPPLCETDRRLDHFDLLGSLRQIEAIGQAEALCNGGIFERVDELPDLACDVLPDGGRVERVVRDLDVKGRVGRVIGGVQGQEDLRHLRVGGDRAGRGDPVDGSGEGDLAGRASAGSVSNIDFQNVGPGQKAKPHAGQVRRVLVAAGRRIGPKGDGFRPVGHGFRDGQGLGRRFAVGDGVLVGERGRLRADILVASADHGVRVVGNGLGVSGPVCRFSAVRVDRLHADLIIRPARRNRVRDGLRRRDPDLGVGSGIDPAFPDITDRVPLRVGGPAGGDRQLLAGARGPVGDGRRGGGRLVPLKDISPVCVRCIRYQSVRGQK